MELTRGMDYQVERKCDDERQDHFIDFEVQIGFNVLEIH